MMLRLIATALIAVGLIAPLGTASVAEPLEPAECKALQGQKQSLLTKTVRAALTRGPDWVKEHLHDEEQIEKVREYLQVEEKVAFRCRTDGVRIPKPSPPPLPDRKPPVPTYVADVAEDEPSQILAGMAATSLLPLRKPARESPKTIEAVLAADEDGTGDGSGPGDIVPPAKSEPAEPGSSQTIAESDKTAPSN